MAHIYYINYTTSSPEVLTSLFLSLVRFSDLLQLIECGPQDCRKLNSITAFPFGPRRNRPAGGFYDLEIQLKSNDLSGRGDNSAILFPCPEQDISSPTRWLKFIMCTSRPSGGGSTRGNSKRSFHQEAGDTSYQTVRLNRKKR